MTVFIAGIHGVGKTFLCDSYANKFGVIHHSSSSLIKMEKRSSNWGGDKRTYNIDENQLALSIAVKRILSSGARLLLDGHFVLKDENNNLINIPLEFFSEISISGVVLIEADEDVIKARLRVRDNNATPGDIKCFIEAERIHAEYVCDKLQIKLVRLYSPSDKEFQEAVNSLFREV
ncbi:ATP-binding protein (plasmid) [Pseudomonas luteola]